jgi:hypothetical protein
VTHLNEKITPLDGMTFQFGKISVTVHLKIGSWVGRTTVFLL